MFRNAQTFARFICFSNKMAIFGVVFWCVKNQVISLSFKDLFPDPHETPKDL